MTFPGFQIGLLEKQSSPSFMCAGTVSPKTAAAAVDEQAALHHVHTTNGSDTVIASLIVHQTYSHLHLGRQ